MVPKENAAGLLKILMNLLPSDISVEEEEIGTIVERIYQEGGAHERSDYCLWD